MSANLHLSASHFRSASLQFSGGCCKMKPAEHSPSKPPDNASTSTGDTFKLSSTRETKSTKGTSSASHCHSTSEKPDQTPETVKPEEPQKMHWLRGIGRWIKAFFRGFWEDLKLILKAPTDKDAKN